MEIVSNHLHAPSFVISLRNIMCLRPSRWVGKSDKNINFNCKGVRAQSRILWSGHRGKLRLWKLIYPRAYSITLSSTLIKREAEILEANIPQRLLDHLVPNPDKDKLFYILLRLNCKDIII